MIFALLDYLNYRKHRGPYSPATIERQGGKFATQSLYSCLEDAQPGDHMLYHGSNSILSWLVMYFTESIWSHIAVFGENGYLYDLTTSGLIKHHFSDYLDGNGYITLGRQKQITKEQVQKSIQWVEEQLKRGCRFSWWKVFCLGVAILFGGHRHYRFRLTIDFLVLCNLFLPLSFLSPTYGYVSHALMILHCCVVLLNRPRRVAMAASLMPKDAQPTIPM